MARKPNWPPRPHHHKPSGQDRVQYRGRDYYLGPHNSAKARQAYVDLIRRLEGEQDAKAPVRPTVADVVAAWGVHAIETYGPDSPEVREFEYVTEAALSLFAALPADEFDVDHLEQVRDALLAAKLCRNVVNRRIVRFRTLWRWAERRKLAPKGSWANLRTLPALRRGERGARETKKVAPAEWAVVEAVCAKASESVRALLLVQWYTGARPGELFLLRVGLLKVEGDLAVYSPEKHKNAWRGQDRAVFFGPRALAAVKGLVDGKHADDLVFPNRDGGPFTRRTYGRAVARAAAKAGVKLHVYSLRHSFKQRAARELSLDAARAAMGQASMSSTEKYAAGQDGKLASDVARRIG